ncbi:hypothetical protein [Hyalangium gracile]|uniref:hypothetical protein n=1 Tax=Hyalangium gracile TaxID=394092 RepID=UPI0021E18CA1|nr:hypothetical protein [Hyalangium gracile]
MDALLTQAARRLAREALKASVTSAPDPRAATVAVSWEDGADLVTTTAAVRATAPEHALELL